jgi:hypothetical protein
VIPFVSQLVVEEVKKRGFFFKKFFWLKHCPPRLGIREGSIACTAKLATCGLSIDNCMTSRTDLFNMEIRLHRYQDKNGSM